jgi:hypothetical protein
LLPYFFLMDFVAIAIPSFPYTLADSREPTPETGGSTIEPDPSNALQATASKY